MVTLFLVYRFPLSDDQGNRASKEEFDVSGYVYQMDDRKRHGTKTTNALEFEIASYFFRSTSKLIFE